MDIKSNYFPKYSFLYVSPGGNSSYSTDIVLDIDNLERFICYLDSEIKRKDSAYAQRLLMTKKLREEIKIRDNYICCNCGVSIHDEPHLLLEIDHIHPVSKGGKTERDNLQTLCWKCNREKGVK